MNTKKVLAATLAVSSIIAAATIASPAKSEEVRITGLGFIFSAPICTIPSNVPTHCISYGATHALVADFCQRRPKTPINVVGHSLGASDLIILVNGLHACGLRVKSAVFLDPQTHPRAFGIPKNIRTLTLYSAGWRGVGEKKVAYSNPSNEGVMNAFDPSARLGTYDDAEEYYGGHIGQAWDFSLHQRIRAFFDAVK